MIYRIGIVAGLLHTSEIMGVNTVTFRVQAVIVLLGFRLRRTLVWYCEYVGVLFLYNETGSYLATEEMEFSIVAFGPDFV